MLVVFTGRVSPVLDIIVVILGLLGDAASEEAFALLGDNVGNVAALGLEVLFHFAGFIFSTIVLKHRVTGEFSDRVKHTDGLHLAAVHVHADL